MPVRVAAEGMNGDDAGVLDGPRDQGLGEERVDAGGVRVQRLDHLDGHLAAQRSLPREENPAHPALAQHPGHLELRVPTSRPGASGVTSGVNPVEPVDDDQRQLR